MAKRFSVHIGLPSRSAETVKSLFVPLLAERTIGRSPRQAQGCNIRATVRGLVCPFACRDERRLGLARVREALVRIAREDALEEHIHRLRHRRQRGGWLDQQLAQDLDRVLAAMRWFAGEAFVEYHAEAEEVRARVHGRAARL